jgi:hypothetical protein
MRIVVVTRPPAGEVQMRSEYKDRPLDQTVQ